MIFLEMWFRRILFILAGLFILNASFSQYLGWDLKRISGSIKWDCNCPFEKKFNDNEKAVFVFPDEYGVVEMTFYFNSKNKCFGYKLSYYKNFDETINNFIKKSFEYNADEDFYENNESFLFQQADSEKKTIHIISKHYTSQ